MEPDRALEEILKRKWKSTTASSGELEKSNVLGM